MAKRFLDKFGLEHFYNLIKTGKIDAKTVKGHTVEVDVRGNATQSSAGLMSAEDKTKLDGISSDLLDVFYPVGSYYETSNASFDPNTAWGGTWELENDGRVLIAANSDYGVGTTGGETTHKLSAAESGVPAHNHSIPAHNHSASASGGKVSDHAAFNTGGMSANGTVSGQFSIRNAASEVDTVWSASGGFSISDSGHAVTALEFRDSYRDSSIVSFSQSIAHTHSVPAHGHGFTNPTITVNNKDAFNSSNNSAATAANAHNNMQPYKAVNRWHRTN